MIHFIQHNHLIRIPKCWEVKPGRRQVHPLSLSVTCLSSSGPIRLSCMSPLSSAMTLCPRPRQNYTVAAERVKSVQKKESNEKSLSFRYDVLLLMWKCYQGLMWCCTNSSVPFVGFPEHLGAVTSPSRSFHLFICKVSWLAAESIEV